MYSELGSGTWTTANTSTNTIILTGLAAYSPYEWAVLAFCDPNGLNNSDTISGANFTTANPCAPPGGLSTTNILLDRVTLNWNSVALAHHYEIRVRELGTATWTNIINVYGNSRTKTGLSSATTYEWEIRSICSADGSSFSDWSSTQLTTTLTPCPNITNPNTSSITLNSATLAWDATPGAYAYRLRFKESSAPWSAWQYDTILAPVSSLDKSGLNAGTNYHWQVQVLCEASGVNNSGFTTYQNFSTLPLCTDPHTLSVTQVTLNSAKLIMYGPNNPDHYYVLYKDVASSVWDTVILSGGDISGTYAFKIVTGLSSATTYEWKSQASCQSDDSNLSGFVNGPNFTTITPCAIPSNLVSVVNGQDVSFSWDAVSGAVFYTLRYRIIGGNWQTISNLNSPSYSVTNLGFGFDFEWEVSSHCDYISLNYSAFSTAVNFSTFDCPIPQNMSVTNILTDRVTINWTFNNSVHHYAARVREVGTSVWTKNIPYIYSGTRTVTGLLEGVTYEYQLRSACTHDTSNVSAWTSMHTFTTLENCNAVPTAQLVSNISLTSADLSFTGTPNAGLYVVRFKEVAGAWSSWQYDTLISPNSSINKTGLQPATDYHWQVKAICDLTSANFSGWTSYNQFNTLFPCNDPSNLIVLGGQTTSSSLKLRWTGVNSVYGYKLAFKESTVSNWDTLLIVGSTVSPLTNLPSGVSAAMTSTGSNTDILLTGLSAGVTYNWQLMAVCQASGVNNSTFVNGPDGTTLPPCTVPGSLSVSSITTNSAKLNWGSTPTAHHYAIRLRQSGTTTWTVNIANAYGNSRNVFNLNAGVDYDWQIRTICSVDTSEVSPWSSIQTFTTIVSCSAVPTLQTTSSITLTSANLSFTGTTNAQLYVVRFKGIAAAWSAWQYDTLVAPNITISKTGLNPGTFYHWQVKAMCDLTGSNVSAWTGYETFTTNQPCSDPYNLMVQNIYTTSNSASMKYRGQMNTNHLVMIKEIGASNWDTINVNSGSVIAITTLPAGLTITSTYSGSENTLNCTGLSPATTYEWQVMAACASYNMSNAISGTSFTTSDPCITPASLSTTNITTTTAKLNWGAAVAHHYALRGRIQGATSWSFDLPFLSSNSRTVYNLVAGEDYEWQIRSVCSHDTSEVSPWSALQSFSTLVNCDNSPSNLTVSNVDLTTATISWDPLLSAQAYEVRFRKTTDPWSANVHTITTNTSLNKTGLTPGSDYIWSIRSICDTANNVVSQWGTWKSFTTSSPCAIPYNLMKLNSTITLTEASVRWYGQMNIDYYFIFKDNSSSNWDTVIVNGSTVTNVSLLPFGMNVTTFVSGSESNVSISGLAPSTTYEWQIIAACSNLNTSIAVNGPSFTTLTGCAIPGNLNTSSISTTTATISWDAVTDAVKYDARRKQLGSSTWSYINNLTSNSRNLAGLTPGTTYLWEVRSHCDWSNGNISSWSSTQQFTTGVVCTTPTNPGEINITSNSTDFVWDAIPSGAWGYRLMYLKQGAAWGTKIVDTVSTNLYNAINLDPNTTYRWRVQALCEQSGSNNSGFTGFRYFTTISSSRITAGDVELAEDLNIYPNPTDGIFNISFISEELDNFEISVFDAFGKQIFIEEKQNFIGEYTKQIDLFDYKKGIYLVHIRTKNSFTSKRIVFQ